MDQRKFEEFLLSPTHPVGKHKLRLWRSTFGIGEGDGDLLEQLIAAIIEEREPRPLPEEPTLTIRQWELLIPDFMGPNGNVGPVKTGWALDPRQQRPHMTNAFPAVG
jgi:hypothetical protein